MKKDFTIIEIRIRFLRDLKGLTQKQVAEALNVSQSLVNSWENGYINVSIKQLVRIAYFYSVPVDYILGLTTKFNPVKYNFKKDLDLKYLGKRVRIIRKIKNLTQSDFAKQVHSNASNISYYEVGKMMMSCAELKEICNTFGFSADWCLGNTLDCIRRKPKITLDVDEYKEFINI